MKINLRKSAIKDLRKISSVEKKRIHSKIQMLTDFPSISGCKKLTNFEPAYRLRVGNYRILFDVINDNIEIARVLHRRESYKN